MHGWNDMDTIIVRVLQCRWKYLYLEIKWLYNIQNQYLKSTIVNIKFLNLLIKIKKLYLAINLTKTAILICIKLTNLLELNQFEKEKLTDF